MIDIHTCTACNCDSQGSLDSTCDREGQCSCKPGVGGLTCDACLPGYYGFESGEGCRACECDPLGASSAQCDALGQCTCREGVTGEKCDRCQFGYSNLTDSGCL